MNRRSLLAFLALTTAGCATGGPHFYSDYDPGADFGRFHTYCWAYTKVPDGMNPFLMERVQNSIDRVLAARGYQRVDVGEFAVGFNLGTRINMDSGYYGGYYSGWGYTPSTEGELTINIYDNATRRAIWHGVVAEDIVADGPIDWPKLEHAVDLALSHFPPPPPKA